MSTPDLVDLREDLAALVTAAGIEAVASIPAKITPPIAFVAPDDPYVDFDGATLAEAIAHHQVVIVVDRGDNDVQIDALDAALLGLLTAFQTGQLGEHVITSVSTPGEISLNNNVYLAVGVSTAIPFRLR